MKTIPVLPALVALLASCAPFMQQSMPTASTSRAYTTTCAAALDAVATQAFRQKPASSVSEWGSWAVQNRTPTAVSLVARNGANMANATITCTQAGNRATLTMRSSGPNISPAATNEGFLENLTLPK